MNYSEFESIKKFDKSLKGAESINKINKLLRKVGIGSKKLDNLLKPIIKLREEFEDHVNYTQEFNKLFSEKGWIAYESLDSEFIKNAVSICKITGLVSAEEFILEYYLPENIKNKILSFQGIEELDKRFKFIQYAFDDYKEKKYYSVVPLLLMIIDGTVNEIVGKGFHAENVNLNVWESITGIDNGIEKIKEIFNTGRRKTRQEIITMPFRNGILHGLDLGYDNYVVAAKCWQFLFVIKDWGQAKHSEEKRKEKFDKSNEKIDFFELAKGLKENDNERKALSKWNKREIKTAYIEEINTGFIIQSKQPEATALLFLNHWKNKKYDEMSKLFRKTSNFYKYVKTVRVQFENQEIKKFKIIKIIDEAPAIAEIFVEVEEVTTIKTFKIRMIYNDNLGNLKSSNLEKYIWGIEYCLEEKE